MEMYQYGRDEEVAPTKSIRSRAGGGSYQVHTVATRRSLLPRGEMYQYGRDQEVAPTKSIRSRPGGRSYQEGNISIRSRAGGCSYQEGNISIRSRAGGCSYQVHTVATGRVAPTNRGMYPYGRDREVAPTNIMRNMYEQNKKSCDEK